MDIFDTIQIQENLKPNTKLVWLEVCTNPHIMIVDLVKVIKIIKSYNSNIIVGVDNTFLSPWTVVSCIYKLQNNLNSCIYLYYIYWKLKLCIGPLKYLQYYEYIYYVL